MDHTFYHIQSWKHTNFLREAQGWILIKQCLYGNKGQVLPPLGWCCSLQVVGEFIYRHSKKQQFLKFTGTCYYFPLIFWCSGSVQKYYAWFTCFLSSRCWSFSTYFQMSVVLPLSENCMYNLSDLEVETRNGCITINTCIVGTRKSSRSPSIPSLPSVNHRQGLQANPNLSYINFCPPNLWLIEESFSWVAGSINCHGRYYSLVLVAILWYAVT